MKSCIGGNCSDYSAYLGYRSRRIDHGSSFSQLLHLAHALIWYCCCAQVHVVVVCTGVCLQCARVHVSMGCWVRAIV